VKPPDALFFTPVFVNAAGNDPKSLILEAAEATSRLAVGSITQWSYQAWL
jgi:hypothetical protein